MNQNIIYSLIDIERRVQEILDDLQGIREQVFYASDPNGADAVTQEDMEAERQAAFEYLVSNAEYVGI